MSNSIDFKIVVPLVKSATDDGRWIIRGVAAGIKPDLQGDVLLPQAITMLAEQINTGSIPLRNQHKVDNITEDMGLLIKASIRPDWELEIEAELDQDNPDAQYLWKKVNQGKQYGLSINAGSAGYVHDVENGKKVRKHPYVRLGEVSVTTRPVYTPSLGTVLRKAIDEAESSSSNEGEMETTQNTVEDTQATSSAPENDGATELTPSQVLVKDLVANDEFRQLMKSLVSESAETPIVEDKTSDDTTQAPATVSTTEIAELVKSTITATSAVFTAKLDEVLGKIPEQGAPTLLVKSDEEKVEDILSGLDSSDRLRLGLAALKGELGKIR
jgi:hypothetical protein